MTSEKELQSQVADFLRVQYPDVLFHSDFGSGVKLTPAQAAIQKRQNGGRRAWPDMFIARARDSFSSSPEFMQYGYEVSFEGFRVCQGLFLELKKDGTRLKKKDGDWASEHIAEQAKVLGKLRDEGYCAEFAVGFDEAVRIIKEYIGENRARRK